MLICIGNRKNMKKVIAVGFLLALFGMSAYAQQRAQYSQYMVNQYVLNPAVTGTYDYAHLVAGYRNQWVGAFGGDAPITYYISGHTSIGRGSKKPHPFLNKHSGYHSAGGMVYQDQTGPTSRMGLMGSYSYNERIFGKWRAALGISLGVQQYSLLGDKLHFGDATEQLGTQRRLLPDGSIGFWTYNTHVYFGGAIQQIFQNRLNFDLPITNDGAQKVSKLANHYFLTSGIRLDVDYDWAIVPSIMLKFNRPAPVSIDANVKARYKDMVWFGTSYRNLDSFVFLFGFVIGRQLEFGYSYDLTVSKIRSYTSGSHEIIIGLRLWPKAYLDCPSNFW